MAEMWNQGSETSNISRLSWTTGDPQKWPKTNKGIPIFARAVQTRQGDL